MHGAWQTAASCCLKAILHFWVLLMQELPRAKFFCGVNRDMRDIVLLGDILDLKERVYPSSCVRHT